MSKIKEIMHFVGCSDAGVIRLLVNCSQCDRLMADQEGSFYCGNKKSQLKLAFVFNDYCTMIINGQ